MFYQSEGLPLNQTKHNKAKIVWGRFLIFSEGKYSDDHRVTACEKSTFVLEKNAKLQEVPVDCIKPTISMGQTKEAGTEFSKTFLVWIKNVGCIIKFQDYIAFLHLIKKD